MIWLDAQISPFLARWIEETLGVPVLALRDLGLRDADDNAIFDQARKNDVILMTKDADFLQLLERHGPPPRILWITCGNTSNEHLRTVLAKALPEALMLLSAGEPLVEIGEV